jgi:outer membrane lipopolysaccharide assembly protein LptE/RlpB
MQSIKFFSVFCLITLLCACGFHLRQHHMDLSAKYPIIALPPTGSNTLHQALSRALIASAVEVQEDVLPGEILPTLVVHAEELTAEPLVYGTDSELRRERLKMAVTFSFGFEASKQFELTTERDRQLSSKQHLGDNAEKIIIEKEMQADIISQLLRYLAYSG